MILPQQGEQPGGEARYDAGTLQKVTALAQQLQKRHQETLSAQEIEAAGREVGLEPAFVRQALAEVTRQRTAVQAPKIALPPARPKSLATAWWAGAWAIPFSMMVLAGSFLGGAIGAALFFLGWGLYVGVGIFLSGQAESEPLASGQLSRSELLDTLFTLQRELEGQKQHRAFLSVDVVGSSEMKRTAPELAVEHSFRRFQGWVEEVVQRNGGEIQAAAGDGLMSVFPEDVRALRAGRDLQEGLGRFNAQENRLPQPFQLRCGISAGPVAIEEGTPLGRLHSPVIDRAAALQKSAPPGDILVGSEMAAAALMELGSAARLPEPVAGEPAFSWRGAGPRALPGGDAGRE